MLKTLFSRRYILMTLLVLAAMAVMARLGVWQLERREGRLARNADLVAKLEAAPTSLNAAAAAAQWPLPSDRDAVRNLPATAAGAFDYAHQLLLVQQNYREMPGAHLVTPLVLAGTNEAILVDQGWIPYEDAQAGRWTGYNDESGEVTVTGRLQPSQILFGRAAEKAQGSTQGSGPQTEWYRIDVDSIQGQMPYQLLPVYLLQSPDPGGSSAYPIRIEPEVDLSEGPHLGYALQWFAFALTAGVVYVALVRSREQKAQAASPSTAHRPDHEAAGVNHA